MALNVKVGLIGAFDMLKFKNMAKVREQAIQAAPANEIIGDYAINRNAKALHPDCLKLVVDEITPHPGAHAKTFVFKREDGKALPYFRAGQYLSLKLQIGDSFVTRPYSICSSPGDALEGKISITVQGNPSGFAADWILENLKIGDKITASAPEGHFYYEELRDEKNVVALAGGSGVTPFIAMARAVAEGAEDYNLTIIFGNRSEASTLFYSELNELAAKCDKIKVVHVLSDEEKEGFEHGFITAELVQKYAQPPYSLFICGPEAMYRFVKAEVAKLGLPRRLVRGEMQAVTKKVWEEPGYPIEAKDKSFRFTVRQGAKEWILEGSANEPVLVAIERAGIKAPSRCRSGECGWCRSKLVSGSVFVPAENEGRRFSDIAHDYIHPCSSFATSDLVIEVPGEYL